MTYLDFAVTPILWPNLNPDQEISMLGDVHKYAANELKIARNPANPFEIDMGDNIDLSKCWKSDVAKARVEQQEMKKEYLNRSCTDNHGLLGILDTPIRFNAKWAGLHSHTVSWSMDKCIAYCTQDPGCGLIGRFVTTGIKALEKTLDRDMAIDDLQRAFDIAVKLDVDILSMAHWHPKERKINHYKGKTFIRNIRGRTIESYREVNSIHKMCLNGMIGANNV